VSPLGAGGMGEVYRARDSRLNRDVALKVLPGAFAGDPERLARFEREAQVLAALKHPNIATIHGIEEKDGAHALVLELVEGETLAEIIGRGPLPADEAVRIARQIADALDAAHEQGIVHRDLKPANVKITPDGSVKVLDFGLAKLTSAQDAISGGPVSVSMSPTMASPTMVTGATVLMGTAGYMSPEQARGKVVDKRADIWAFGVVLFEMLAGARLFDGESLTEVAGAVIHKEPDWSLLPAATSPLVAMVVRRCLQKDPRQRFRDMGDVRLALDGAFFPEGGARVAAATPAPATRSWPLAAAAAVLAAVAAGALVWMLAGRDAVERRSLVFDVGSADMKALTPVMALSPDGRTLAYLAVDGADTPRIWIRSLESGEARMLAPTEQTRQPIFWSPDNRYVAFFSDGKLKKADVAGGPAETIAEVSDFGGGSWGRTGEIVFSDQTNILRIPVTGGTPVAVTAVDKTRKETAHLLPTLLPNGRHFLYLRFFAGADALTGIYAGALDTAPGQQSTTRLLATGQNAAYSTSDGSARGHLLFVRDGLLMAQPFDADTLALTGDPVRVGTDLLEANSVLAALTASANGTLAYLKGSNSVGTLTSVDRAGKAVPMFPQSPMERPRHPRLSPDGRRLAVVLAEALWLYDLDGKPPIKLTFGDERALSPLWTRDGRRLVYERGDAPKTSLFSVPADGSGATPEAVAPEGHFHPHGWSADGEIVGVRVGNNVTDLVRFIPQPGAQVHDLVATTPDGGLAGAVSPDGRWIAYTAEPTGKTEIWVRPVSDAGAAVRVSPNGGNEPIWSRDGRELFYLEDQTMMSVPVTLGTAFNFKAPTMLFAINIVRHPQPPSYDVTPDGGFVMVTAEEQADVPFTVIVNWAELLRGTAAPH
jgi:tRNA A-37 threonylcarbamoyl transferase component Bud32/dipeptidyl aminopeptidase/acylaminoacyl peptidase